MEKKRIFPCLRGSRVSLPGFRADHWQCRWNCGLELFNFQPEKLFQTKQMTGLFGGNVLRHCLVKVVVLGIWAFSWSENSINMWGPFVYKQDSHCDLDQFFFWRGKREEMCGSKFPKRMRSEAGIGEIKSPNLVTVFCQLCFTGKISWRFSSQSFRWTPKGEPNRLTSDKKESP